MGTYQVVTELVPDGASSFQWSDYSTYSSKLITGVSAVSHYVDLPPFESSPDSLLNPPLIADVIGLKGSLESLSGLSWSQLAGLALDVYALSQATSPAEIVQGIATIVTTTTDLVTTAAQAVGLATSVVNVIPIIGQIVGAVLGAVATVLESQALVAQYGAACDKAMAGLLDYHCAKLVEWAKPSATGTSIMPSDLFRPLSYAIQLGKGPGVSREFPRLPLNISALYVALCGPEAQLSDPIFPGEAHPVTFGQKRWNQLVASYRAQTGKHHIGVPAEVQRQMWALIEGVMSAAEPPGLTDNPQPIGDRGRALMPLLQDMVRNLWIAGKVGGRGYGIDRGFLVMLQDVILKSDHNYEDSCKKLIGEAPGAGQAKIVNASCLGRVDLVSPFEASIIAYENQLDETFRPNGEWILPSSPQSAESTLVVSPSVASEMEAGLVSLQDSITKGRGRKGAYSTARAGAASSGGGAAVGLLVAGALGYLVLKKGR